MLQYHILRQKKQIDKKLIENVSNTYILKLHFIKIKTYNLFFSPVIDPHQAYEELQDVVRIAPETQGIRFSIPFSPYCQSSNLVSKVTPLCQLLVAVKL